MAQQLTLILSDIAHGGEAVGRHEGKAIFIPYAIPGETVRVEVVSDKGRFARARLLEVLSPSPHRVSPPCPHFGVCGGCHWQHIAYPAQLDYKRSIILTQLRRIAGLADARVHPTLGMDVPWQYRNHVEFSVSRAGELGLMAASSHQVVPIERCLLLHPLVDELYDALDVELPDLRRLTLRAGVNTGEQMIMVEMQDDQPPEVELDLPVSFILLLSNGTPVNLIGSPYFREQLAGNTYRISAPSFFQVNTQQAEKLLSLVRTHLHATTEDSVIDAYCGVGVFAVELAKTAREVIGIEGSPSAIADARVNGANASNVRFVQGPVEEHLQQGMVRGPLVVLDPPREGLGPKVVAALAELTAKRIVYVSCDPATLARDVKGLLAAGYTLREVQPLDMFPQTYHIESVAILCAE